MKLSRAKNGTFMGRNNIDGGEYQMQIGGGDYQTQMPTTRTNASKVRALKMRRMARKETGWNSTIKPISNYNSQVHPSMRIPFEQM